MPLAIERLVGGLQGGVLGDDLLQLLHTAGVLLREVPLFGDLSLERGYPPPMPAELLLGLFEHLLVALQHTPLLPVRLEQLREIQPQPCLGRTSLLQLGLQGSARGVGVNRPPGRG